MTFSSSPIHTLCSSFWRSSISMPIIYGHYASMLVLLVVVPSLSLLCLCVWMVEMALFPSFSLSLLKRTKLCTYFILSSLSHLFSSIHDASLSVLFYITNKTTKQHHQPKTFSSSVFFPFFLDGYMYVTYDCRDAMPVLLSSFLFYFLACAYSSMIHSFAAN